MREVHGLTVVTLLLLAGCGGNGGGPVASCDLSTRGGNCTEYARAGIADEDLSQLRSYCLEVGGAWQACPAAGRTGTCDITISEDSHSRQVYYAGFVCSVEEGRALCDSYAIGTHTVSYTPGSATCGAATDRTLRCDSPTGLHSCTTFSGAMPPERVDLLRRACAYSSGTLSETPCPTAGTLAVCTGREALGMTGTVAYYAGADLTSVETNCTDDGGTWTLTE